MRGPSAICGPVGDLTSALRERTARPEDVYNAPMKHLIVLLSCVALALAGCDKKKNDAPAKTPPAATPPAATPPAAAPPAATPPAATPPAATPPTAEVPADGIKFPADQHAVGDKVTEVTTEEGTMKLEVGPGKVVEGTSAKSRTEQKEVVAVDAGVVTKLKIGYSAMSDTQTMGGKTRDKPSPLDGKTYLVWREGDEVKVSYADGGAPPADEIAKVAKGNRSVGKPEPMDTFVAGRTWKVGEKVSATPDELAKIGEAMGGDDGPALTGLALTLQSADDAVATMALSMAMEMKGPDGSMALQLDGSARLDRKTGRLLEITGTGPFSGVVKVPMSGTMTMKTVNTY